MRADEKWLMVAVILLSGWGAVLLSGVSECQEPGQPAVITEETPMLVTGGIGGTESTGTLQPFSVAPISGGGTLQDGSFTQYGSPVVLMILLQTIFKLMGPTMLDRWKSPVALVIGVGMGLLCLAYDGGAWSAKQVIDYSLQGLLSGAAATGLYEVQRSVVRPRT